MKSSIFYVCLVVMIMVGNQYAMHPAKLNEPVRTISGWDDVPVVSEKTGQIHRRVILPQSGSNVIYRMKFAGKKNGGDVSLQLVNKTLPGSSLQSIALYRAFKVDKDKFHPIGNITTNGPISELGKSGTISIVLDPRGYVMMPDLETGKGVIAMNLMDDDSTPHGIVKARKNGQKRTHGVRKKIGG